MIKIPVDIYSKNVYVFLKTTDVTKEVVKAFAKEHLAMYFDTDEERKKAVKDTVKFFSKELKGFIKEQANGVHVATYGMHLIVLDNFDFKQAYSHGTLAHEITHASQEILSDTGMTLTRQSCEAYTYLQGYITREIYKHLLEKT